MNTIVNDIKEWDFSQSESNWKNVCRPNLVKALYSEGVANISDVELGSKITGYAMTDTGQVGVVFMGNYESSWVDAWYLGGVLVNEGITFESKTNERVQYELFYLDILLKYQLYEVN